MRVVHHFSEMRLGEGLPQAVVDLARLLAAAGHEVLLLTAEGSPLTAAGSPRERFETVPLDPVSGPGEALSAAGRRRVERAIAAADVVHLHGIWRPRTLRVAAVARRLGRPYVTTLHGMLSDWGMAQGRTLFKRIYYRLFLRRLLGGARQVHCTAEAEREAARSWLPHDRVTVAPLAVNLRAYSELPGPDLFLRRHPDAADGMPAVLTLGRLHPHKQPQLLIEALGALRRRGLACRLLLAGEGEPGYLARLRKLVERHDLAATTHFLGYVGGREKLSLIQRADLLALPSVHENFGLALVESLACGTPVVTTRAVATWPEIAATGGARIVEPTVEEFAGAIAELLAEPEDLAARGEAGRRGIWRWLDPETVRGAYERMYAAALAPPGSRPPAA